MRILVAACGSRGDFQPMLALAVGLKRAGHQPLLGAAPNFAAEAAAFGVPFASVGTDVQKLLAENRHRMSAGRPLKALRFLNEVLLAEMHLQRDALLPLAHQADMVVGGGALLSARTAAEAAGVPYRYVAFTPQDIPHSAYPPMMVPIARAPRWMNHLLWGGMRWFYNRLALSTLNAGRMQLGLRPVDSVIDHLFDARLSFLAADPELLKAPEGAPSEQVGSFCLEDPRPLPAEVERFLEGGPPPIYIGFGSMPDEAPERTTATLHDAVHRAGCRALLSTGWAGLGGAQTNPDVLVIGPVSHWKLFPRLAAVVHHGGAGTTAAAARAGVPQVVLPHAFDQFVIARGVEQTGVGVVIRRAGFSAEALSRALGRVLNDAAMKEAARTAGERIRARKPVERAITILEGAFGASRGALGSMAG